jgi:RNA polymerase sigma-70 factor (ECF subfamily)
MRGAVLAFRPTVCPMPEGLDLAHVYRDCHDSVWRTLHALGVERALVDDATQDVFMVVHRRLPDYDGHTPVRRWVLGIARNVALKYRERSSRAARHLRPLDEPDEPPAPVHDDDASPVEETLARREAASWVERFLAGLDADKRAVFVLCEVEGLSAPEAAGVLDVKLNTVYSRLRTARQQFDQAIARHRAASRRGAWAR